MAHDRFFKANISRTTFRRETPAYDDYAQDSGRNETCIGNDLLKTGFHQLLFVIVKSMWTVV